MSPAPGISLEPEKSSFKPNSFVTFVDIHHQYKALSDVCHSKYIQKIQNIYKKIPFSKSFAYFWGKNI